MSSCWNFQDLHQPPPSRMLLWRLTINLEKALSKRQPTIGEARFFHRKEVVAFSIPIGRLLSTPQWSGVNQMVSNQHDRKQLQGHHFCQCRLSRRFYLDPCDSHRNIYTPIARVVKWQTRAFKGRMPKGMRVRVPPRAPSKQLKNRPRGSVCRLTVIDRHIVEMT